MKLGQRGLVEEGQRGGAAPHPFFPITANSSHVYEVDNTSLRDELMRMAEVS